MEAVILAGGKGTRLKSVLAGKPKPLVDVCGKPLLERQIDLLNEYGFSKVWILVNHKADQIIQFLKQRQDWVLDVECVDDGEPRGTAGAVLSIIDRLSDDFLVMYGDTMLNVDLLRFRSVHDAHPDCLGTILLHPNDHPHDSDLVELDDAGLVTAFHPYPHDKGRYLRNLVNAALYWIRKESLESFNSLSQPSDFGKDLFPSALRCGYRIMGYNSPEYIKDAGTPERLDKVCSDLKSGRIARSSLRMKQAMIFLDRDGTINHEVDHLADPESLRLIDGAASAIRRINQSDYRCCVVTNQPVIARGECDEEGLRQIHNKLESLLGDSGAYLDAIYYCPHHPDSGFPGERPELKFECNCRKPMLGMIETACREFNVDPAESWLVGDSTADIETAARAGVRSILVETGYGGLDLKYWAQPHFVFGDLVEATQFLLDEYPLLRAATDKLAEDVQERTIIFVGGQSRSGKTTFASTLSESLAAQGHRVRSMSLDRWLLSAEDRSTGVKGRYDLQAAQSVLNSLRNLEGGEEVKIGLPGYDKLKRESHPRVSEISIQPKDIVIVEGVLALELLAPESWQVRSYFVQSEEEVRKQRVIREYLRRGFNEEEALSIYSNRLGDEWDAVQTSSNKAQLFEMMRTGS